MFKFKNQNWKAYPAALLCMAVVIALLLQSRVHLGPIPTALPLLLPILLASLLGGLVPGLVATILGTVAFAWMFEYTLNFSNGEELTNGIRFASLVIEGALLSIFGEILQMARSNVREADQKNFELQKAEKALKRVDKKKDAFIATLAHELRNPLTPILTAAQILKQESGGDLNQWAGEIIEVQVNHLLSLVNDLLDMSRLTQGKMRLAEEKLALNTVISQAVDIARIEFQQRQQELIVTPIPTVSLNGDRQRLVQVFSNLLLNASKFTPEKGCIQIDVQRKSGQAVVRIRDNGIGIPQDMLSEIFEPFVQIGSAESSYTGGIGIGLPLAKSLVELHGGRIEALSEGANKGSEFVVRLPSLPSDLAVPSQRQSSRFLKKMAKRRILVVDDNAAVTEAIAKLLDRQGMEVGLAFDGESAIKQAISFKPDVVLLDIGLPDKDGYEVIRSLRNLVNPKEMLFIAMTGYSDPSRDENHALEQGFHYYLNKPIDNVQLLDIISLAPGK